MSVAITNPARLLQPAPSRTGTLKEFFDLNTFCGDVVLGLPVRSAFNLNHVYGAKGCGARDWRVIRPNLFRANEHVLICKSCGLHYAVERREIAQ